MCVVGEKNMSKILIVEDDEKLSKELKIFLDKNGYDSVILQKFDNAVEDILKRKCRFNITRYKFAIYRWRIYL